MHQSHFQQTANPNSGTHTSQDANSNGTTLPPLHAPQYHQQLQHQHQQHQQHQQGQHQTQSTQQLPHLAPISQIHPQTQAAALSDHRQYANSAHGSSTQNLYANIPNVQEYHPQQHQQNQPHYSSNISLSSTAQSSSIPTHHQQQQHMPSQSQSHLQQPLIVTSTVPTDVKEMNASSNNSKMAGVSAARRGPWSTDEDSRLLDLIALFGASNWVRISQALGTRTPKQCRERYHQNLKPSLNRSPITREEGELIEQLVATCGKKWAEIARHLNGRSDNAVKNWWNGGANRRRKLSGQHDSAEIKSSGQSTTDHQVTAGATGDIAPKIEQAQQQQRQSSMSAAASDNKIAFNTGIFSPYQQQQQQQTASEQSANSLPPVQIPSAPQQQQQQPGAVHHQMPHHIHHHQSNPHQQAQRSASFDFKYPQQHQQQQQPPPLQHSNSGGPYQAQDYLYSNISRKQRKLIDEPLSRRHSAAHIGMSSPLSHPPSISSRNSSLSHEFTGFTSYNSSDNESASRRSSVIGANVPSQHEFYQQHRKNNLSHTNIHLSPSFQAQASSASRLSISSQASNTHLSLPPLSPTSYPNSRHNSIHSERLPSLSLSTHNALALTPTTTTSAAGQSQAPLSQQTMSSSGVSNSTVFKREYSLAKLDNNSNNTNKVSESPFPSPSLHQAANSAHQQAYFSSSTVPAAGQHQPLQQQHHHPLQYSQGPIDDDNDTTDKSSKGASPANGSNGVNKQNENNKSVKADAVKESKKNDDQGDHDDRRRMSIANLLG